MTERWVLNASPLIVLAHIGYEHLFDLLANEVVVPQAVAEEIKDGQINDPARQAIINGKFTIVDIVPSPRISAWDLGEGETAVLSYALKESGWTTILDDAAARKCARSFNLPLKGTLAVIILAKQHDVIPSASDLLRSLLENGFRLDERIIRESLSRTVGEQW